MSRMIALPESAGANGNQDMNSPTITLLRVKIARLAASERSAQRQRQLLRQINLLIQLVQS